MNQSLRECSLDSGTPSFGACTSPTQYDQATPLDEGSYTFRIRVEDEAGNTATATCTFSVDLYAAHGHPHGPRPHGAHERFAPELRLDHRGRECP